MSDEEKKESPPAGIYTKRLSGTATNAEPFERGKRKSDGSVKSRTLSIPRSEYHDDLKGSLKKKLTGQLVFTAFIVAFGSSFLFGYNIGVINQPADLVRQFYNESYMARSNGVVKEGSVKMLWTTTVSIFIPGGMFGAFLGGMLADKLGRKKSILLSQFFIILSAILSTLCVKSNLPEMLMLGRALAGVQSGIGNCVAPMFLTEIAPYNLRGAFGTVHQLSITIGIFMSSVFGFDFILGTAAGWPYLFLLEAIPAITSLLVLPWLPETPRYLLLNRGERELAQKALQFYRNTEDVAADMEEMDTEQQKQDKPSAADDDPDKKSFTLKELLTTKELRPPLIIACMLQVIQQLSGINAVFFYSSSIFAQAGVVARHIQYAVMGTNLVNVAMTVITVPMMDIAGRRKLLIYPMAVMIVDLIVITISLNLQESYPGMANLTIVCIIIYVIGFAVGLGPIPMMIGSELFRQGPRTKAMGVVGVTNWVFTFVVGMTFEALQDSLQNFTFLFFFCLMVLFLIYVYFKVPETKNKTFEEIAHQFAPGGNIDVEQEVPVPKAA